MRSSDQSPCTQEHPNPFVGPHEEVVVKNMPGYFKWHCANCGLEVIEAGDGAGR